MDRIQESKGRNQQKIRIREKKTIISEKESQQKSITIEKVSHEKEIMIDVSPQ